MIFKAPVQAKPTAVGSQAVRLRADVHRQVAEIAHKCRIPASQVATACILYALQHAEIREVPLYEMDFAGSATQPKNTTKGGRNRE